MADDLPQAAGPPSGGSPLDIIVKNPGASTTVSAIAAALAIAVQQFIATQSAQMLKLREDVDAIKVTIAVLEKTAASHADIDAVKMQVIELDRAVDTRIDARERTK